MTAFNPGRFEPASAPAGTGRDDALEGLRGMAALAVLYAHLVFPGHQLDPAYAPPEFLGRIEVATLAVMMFFILSGYVIGLTNQRPATAAGIRAYLLRRAQRLLPIYFVAVLLGWFVQPGPSLRDLLGNFFFLQNEAAGNPFHVALLNGNVNLWSLHYEVIYYLLFIGVWWFRPRVASILPVTFAVGALGVFLPGMSRWVAWLACGFVLWLAGLLLAWRLPRTDQAPAGPWPSVLLLCIATWRLHALNSVLAHAGWNVVWVPGVLFTYLDSLPVLLWLFLIVTRRPTRWQTWLETVSWVWPAAYLGWRLVVRGSFGWRDEIVFIAGLVTAAALLRRWTPSLAFWRRIAPVGAISYGLYAFGAPVQILIRSTWPTWSGRWWTYGLARGVVVGPHLRARVVLRALVPAMVPLPVRSPVTGSGSARVTPHSSW